MYLVVVLLSLRIFDASLSSLPFLSFLPLLPSLFPSPVKSPFHILPFFLLFLLFLLFLSSFFLFSSFSFVTCLSVSFASFVFSSLSSLRHLRLLFLLSPGSSCASLMSSLLFFFASIVRVHFPSSRSSAGGSIILGLLGEINAHHVRSVLQSVV